MPKEKINILGGVYSPTAGTIYIGTQGSNPIECHADDSISPATPGIPYFALDGKAWIWMDGAWVDHAARYHVRDAGKPTAEHRCTLVEALEAWEGNQDGIEVIAQVDTKRDETDEHGLVRFIIAGPSVGLEEDLYPPMRAPELVDALRKMPITVSKLEQRAGIPKYRLGSMAANNKPVSDGLRLRLREAIANTIGELEQLANRI